MPITLRKRVTSTSSFTFEELLTTIREMQTGVSISFCPDNMLSYVELERYEDCWVADCADGILEDDEGNDTHTSPEALLQVIIDYWREEEEGLEI